LNKLICKAGNVVGVKFDSLSVVSERRMLSKLKVILNNVSHPLYDLVLKQRSTFSARLILPKCTTERHRKSFLTVAIKLYNSSLGKLFSEFLNCLYLVAVQNYLFNMSCFKLMCIILVVIYFIVHWNITFYEYVLLLLIHITECFIIFIVVYYICGQT